MQSAFASGRRSFRDTPVAAPGSGWVAGYRVSDEDPRSDQPEARSCNQYGNGTWFCPLLCRSQQPRSSQQVKTSSKGKVRSLLPTSVSCSERADRVALPPLPRSSRPDHGIGSDEEWTGSGTTHDSNWDLVLLACPFRHP